MKRVVIEIKDTETIELEKCKDSHYYLAHAEGASRWGQVVKITGSEYVVSKTNEPNYDLKKFKSIQELIRYCSGIYTFYQFPDFRSAMQYYLEQTK